jgi:GAF domain-containing protein/HAMP domain-containing protein
MVISTPLLFGVSAFIGISATSVVREQANITLQESNKLVESNLNTWMTLHGSALQALILQPAITSMNPLQQKPVMETMSRAYPSLYLVHTLNLRGVNVARSDNELPAEYADRLWFQRARDGASLTFELVISRTLGKPALSISAPIKNSAGAIIGVADINTTLDNISESIGATKIGESGYVFVVDEQNRLAAHPDTTLTTADRLNDFSNYPPIAELRQGATGVFEFTDENGVEWIAYISRMDNGWGVVAQQPRVELLSTMMRVQTITIISIVVGLLILLILLGLAISRMLQPIANLTQTAEAISAGDIDQRAEVTSANEIGILASAFNNMTTQLRDAIANLESRVADRTNELMRSTEELQERSAELEEFNQRVLGRTSQFQALAKVSHAIASIRELEVLLPTVTRVISEHFGFYHAGIFLADDANEYAILSAANSTGGQNMLKRGHKLRIGKAGIVGNVVSTGVPRIALDTTADAAFQENPDLPDTHSEMALPLRIGTQIIGALDVQSTEPQAFSEEDIEVLTTLADQVSIAIQNARLFDETKRAANENQILLQQYAREQWSSLIKSRKKVGYRYTGKVEELKEKIDTPAPDPATAEVPITIRGQVIGTVSIRSANEKGFSQDELDIIRAATERAAIAAENARLFEQTTERAERERKVSEITSKIRTSNDPNEMIQIALNELKQTLNIRDARILPYKPAQDDKS